MAQIISKWEELVTPNKPRAVSFFLGREDYSKGSLGLEAFEANLKSFIEKALALKNNTGYAVIQLPYYTGESESALIQSYIDKVYEVIDNPDNGLISNAERYYRILVVDHFSQTQEIENWTENYLTDGYLNQQGHFEIGRQLCQATIKIELKKYPNDFVATSLQSRIYDIPQVFSELAPVVTADKNSIGLTLSEEIINTYGTEYDYEITLKDKESNSQWKVTNSIQVEDGKEIVIAGLKENSSFTLQLRTKDGSVQLKSMDGSLGEEATVSVHQPLAFTQAADDKQKELKDKLEAGPVRWLFVGDSITHGALRTNGYDGIAQLFEKYVREGLGREDDIIINTAISGATIADNIEEGRKDIRLGWNADVVMVMLGTNDAATPGLSTKEQYTNNLNLLVEEIKRQNPDALVVFRTPLWTARGDRWRQLIPIVDAMKTLAAETDAEGNTKADFLVDQYTPSIRALYDLLWLYASGNGGDLLYGDNLHPNELGHVLMFRQLVEELGLADNDTPMMHLMYDKITSGITENDTDLTEFLNTRKEDNSILLDVSGLTGAVTDLASVTFKVRDVATNQSWETSMDRQVEVSEENTSISVYWPQDSHLSIQVPNLNKAYEITVTGWSKSGANELVMKGMLSLEDYGDVLAKDIPQDGEIPEGIWVAGVKDLDYTGAKLTQEFRVYDHKTLLKEKTDYTVSYKNNQKAYVYDDKDLADYEKLLETNPKVTGSGDFVAKKAAAVVLKMKGNYSGTKSVFFKINKADISTALADSITVTYTGKNQTPTPVVTLNGKKLTLNKDYEIPEYLADKASKSNFKGVSEQDTNYSLTLKGIGNYTGENPIILTIGAKNESIQKISMSKVKVSGVKALTWVEEIAKNGGMKQHALSVTNGKDILVEETTSNENGEFTITYQNNDKVGTATILLTGNGQDKDGDKLAYIGTKRITFKINGNSMSKVKVENLDTAGYFFTGDEICPLNPSVDGDAKVTFNGIPMEEGTYDVDYEKNIEKGTATIILTGVETEGFSGVKKQTFKITAAAIDDDTNEASKKFTLEITDSARNDGEVTGEITMPFTKGGVKPSVTITNPQGVVMTEGVDYTVSYKNNKNLGSFTAGKAAPARVVKGKGNYQGTEEVYF
ncbi:MAG: SGNH/GDSL hydrolase family protein, partial [Lachnospiraceae bacterium]|nr:SGNH/GDSL hydrolase family protein [Lachnospiraceae bacterium]